MSDFNFKDIVDKQYEARLKATAPIPEVDAYVFCTSSKYLGERLFPWQSLTIKILYGLWKKYPITKEEQEVIDLLKEKWHINFDLENRNPQQVVEILILVLGRRSGKSSLISFIQTYEAYKLICKGDPQRYYNIRARHPIWIVNCAKDGEQAQDPFRLCKNNIRRMPFFQKYIDWSKDNESEMRLFTPADLYENEQIQKYNQNRPKNAPKKNLQPGSITIAAFTTTAASKRGKAIIMLILDEFAHFDRAKTSGGGLTEEDILAEMPQTDYAMLKALSPATKDFNIRVSEDTVDDNILYDTDNNGEYQIYDGKIIMISSPREKGGEFYKHYCLAGGMEQANPNRTDIRKNYFLMQMASWECNPKYSRGSFASDFQKDSVGANMEFGGHFGEPSTTFIDSSKVDEMVDEARPMNYIGRQFYQYIISVDPASKGDTYAVSWGHIERDWIIVDGIHGFRPEIVSNDATGQMIKVPVHPGKVVGFIKALAFALSRHGTLLEVVYDQWNCLPTSTVLNTANGLKTIGELVQSNQDIIVATKDGHAIATKFFDNGIRSVKALKTKFGYTLSGTDNHPVWTPNGWINISNLRVGDKIAVQPGRLFATSDTISPEQAIVYGYLTGDGTCTGVCKGTIELTNIDPDVQKEFGQLSRNVFAVTTRDSLRNIDFYSTALSKHYGQITIDNVRFNSMRIEDILRKDGVCGTSFTKRVPAPVREGSRNIVCAYLSALYECDGNVGYYTQKRAKYQQKDVYIEYNTRSKQLAIDVHLLLLNLGIISSLTTYNQVGKPCYRIMIRGENIEIFAEHVHFRSTRKRAQLDAVLEHLSSLDKFRRKSYLNTDDIYWDTLTEISNAGEERVYDITVPGPHSFIANGITTHNSQESILALKTEGYTAVETFFTNKYKNEMYTNFLEKLNAGKVKTFGKAPEIILDAFPPFQIGWLEQAKLELKYLNRITSGNTVYYAAPDTGPIQTDDFADVLANLSHRLMMYASGDRNIYKELYKQTGTPIKRPTGFKGKLTNNPFQPVSMNSKIQRLQNRVRGK